ncbi:hypothetical protein [Lignipirellula cremea]|uniref:Hemerythrin-like domain-containing protein n=1 Tax=Lignipirellula cremea TaxID=2528010 RepID=A0A518E455_9BACT|nr:hypothetical protein [Lignipirellula cremea]QDU98869.1 hypothetical protein Pla8534_67800 [Lignipirellula cremea]
MFESDESHTWLRHLQTQHRSINDRLFHMETALLPALESMGEQPPPCVLEDLRTELMRHFQQEEEGGCLEKALCRCPSLGEEVREIEAEHPRLLHDLDQLIESTQNPWNGVEASRIAKAFENLAQRIRNHEAAENRILVQAFGTHADIP